jgi:hypothetical protein
LISNTGLYEYDIPNNLLIKYPKADIDVLRAININRGLFDITYNKSLDGFYTVINKQDRNAEVIFVKREDLLGTEKEVSTIYELTNGDNDSLWIGLTSAFLIGVFAVAILSRKKKTLAGSIISMSSELESELKSEEFKVLMSIASADPDYVNYTALMDAFPDHLGYESKKKKLRMTLIYLEHYLEEKLKIKGPVFKIRKNIEDKREKQIKLG